MEAQGVQEFSEINQYFKSVIDLIPIDSYFAKSMTTSESSQAKYNGKKSLSAKAKQMLVKRRKFDLQHMKTTSERITQFERTSDDESVALKKKVKISSLDSKPASIDDLRRRLKEKINEIQRSRNPKNRSEEEQELIRNRRRKERAKFKLRRKLKMQQKLGNAVSEYRGLQGQKNSTIKPNGVMKKSTNVSSNKPVINSDGQVVFSKFDFGKEAGTKNKKRNKTSADLPAVKNLKSLLLKAESKKQKIEELKEKDPEEATKVIKTEAWEKALAKASGTKMKDDPELLKKSIKKNQSIKKQSAKKWKERQENVADKMKRRQERREKNIQSRKDNKKDKKVNKRMKKLSKSKYTPGF